MRAHRVDLIYIALPMASQPRILRLLEELRDTTASIYFVPDIFMFDLIQARVDTVGGMPVVAVCETPVLRHQRRGQALSATSCSPSLILVAHRAADARASRSA